MTLDVRLLRNDLFWLVFNSIVSSSALAKDSKSCCEATPPSCLQIQIVEPHVMSRSSRFRIQLRCDQAASALKPPTGGCVGGRVECSQCARPIASNWSSSSLWSDSLYPQHYPQHCKNQVQDAGFSRNMWPRTFFKKGKVPRSAATCTARRHMSLKLN